MGLSGDEAPPKEHINHWNEEDIFLITYGDSLWQDGEAPLQSLKSFYCSHLKDSINSIHILPFFPYSSDDGFSVIDYVQVNQGLGEWEDIEAIASECKLMSDLVINHCSSRSRWFENYKQRRDPGKSFFVEANPEEDLSLVVRPRTSPLLREVETLDGTRHVWCTFSHDQVDLDFANPEVLAEFVKIIRFYIDRGVKVFRFDAVAFLWKEIGTPCVNHAKTHEVIRLLRLLIEAHTSDAIIITETNLPNHENLSYFGNANEAHAIYNFSLPPLILHTMLSGNSQAIKQWQMSMPPAQDGTFYFNFLASHDGIGLRPAEGLINEDDVQAMISSAQKFGGAVSWRTSDSGEAKAYEINITFYEAMKGTHGGEDQWHSDRFMCAHAIMLSLEGVPAFYIHSLLATENYHEGIELSSQNRAINRYKWNLPEIESLLGDKNTHHHKIFTKIKALIEIRTAQPAFHPNSTQYTLHLGDQVFGFWRQSPRRDQSIFCIHNISDQSLTIPLSSINLINLENWSDLISGEQYSDLDDNLILKPYQFVWISNKQHD
jgi:sucrose phosphorylase